MTPTGAPTLAVVACLWAAAAAAQPAPEAPVHAPRRAAPPLHVDETGRNPDGPAGAESVAYDSRIRSSAASAQAFQGPLDGSWTLSAEGRELYLLQLVDRDGVLEGSWRDPRRPGALEGSGYLDVVDHSDGGLILSFTGAFAVLRLVDGLWTGQLTEGEQRERVMLVRRGP